VILATVECIWGAICGSLAIEDQFVENDGIYLLLNVLEVASYNMKRQTLGCLLDLLENPKTIYYISEWRMKNNPEKGFPNLLISIWKEEEIKLAVPEVEGGMLPSSSRFPLHGTHQVLSFIDVMEGGPSIWEIHQNLRAKIYSLFCKIGFDAHSVPLSNEELIKLELVSFFLCRFQNISTLKPEKYGPKLQKN
jgi:hypothetical protein